MTSKLSGLCDRFIEAGWLAALIATPLVFDVFSYRSFDLDKVAVLRSLALFMAAAWVVKGLDAGSRARRPAFGVWLRANPVSALALVWLAATALSTATSIAPRVSWAGSYERWQGLYTTVAYVVLFLSVAALVRTREQLERVVTTVIVVTLPVSLYAIIQHFGTDPITWRGGSVVARASSTLGNPIFLSAYLAMTVPLTLYRLLAAGRSLGAGGASTAAILTGGSLLNLVLHVAAWWLGPLTGTLAALTTLATWIIQARVSERPVVGFARVGVYNVILSTQLAAIVLSQSRGPLLGLVTGLFFFALLWAAATHRRKAALVVMGIAVTIVLTIALALLPGSPVSSGYPALGRLARLTDAGMEGRLLFWEAAWNLATSDALRALVGNGPETMRLAVPRFTPAGVARFYPNLALDRAHNDTLDLLVTTGALGLMAFLALVTAVLYAGLKALGLVRSARDRGVFLGLWIGGGLAAVVASALAMRSGRLAGLALPLGMLAGLTVYLSGRVLGPQRSARSPEADDRSPSLIVPALLGGIVAHFTEIQLGIAVESTRIGFWVDAALLVAVTRIPLADHDASAAPVVPSRRPIVGSVLATFVLLTLVYDLLSFPLDRADLMSVGWLLVFTWILAGVVVLTEARTTWTWSRAGLRYVAVSVTAVALLGAALARFVLSGVETNAPVIYHAVTVITLVAIAVALVPDGQHAGRVMGRRVALAGLALLGLAGLAAVANLQLVRADVLYKGAWLGFHRGARYAAAAELSRGATAMAPGQPVYHFLHGQALAELAQRTVEPAARERLFRQAEQSIRRARDLNPRDVDGTGQLAHLFHVWGRYTDEPGERAARLRTALDLYRQATEASPSNALFWDGWGITLAAAGDEAQAREKLERALALDDRLASAHVHLGDLASAAGRWDEAAAAYTRALARDPGSIAAHRGLGILYARTGQPDRARVHTERARTLENRP